MIPADPLRNLGPATILRGDARALPLADNSLDLIVTSPPYFALRSYQDACGTCGGIQPNDLGLSGSAITSTLHTPGERSGTSRRRIPDPDCPDCHGEGKGHYAGQLGSEATPAEFVDALIACTREMVRVVKPSGSIWVNLGDKYDSGTSTGRVNPGTVKDGKGQGWYQGTPRWTSGRPKSLLGIPWRYAIRCIDDLGLILRAHVVWSKPNGLPESVTDRVRRSHEDWFHFVTQPRYYSAVDEIREAASEPQRSTGVTERHLKRGGGNLTRHDGTQSRASTWGVEGQRTYNALGKLPGSVWTIPTEPLRVPDHLGVDHFAAFPSEWPKRIIRGWSPAGVCTACGEGRRPVVEKQLQNVSISTRSKLARQGGRSRTNHGYASVGVPMPMGSTEATITGYACACTPSHIEVRPGWTEDDPGREVVVYDWHLWDAAPTTPGLILDPFGGTGTVAMVARALGRHGIHVDLSADYNRLARWRITNLDQLAAVQGHERTKRQPDDQPTLLDEIPEVPA